MFSTDRRVPAELGQESQASSCLRKGTPLSSRVAQGVSGPSSSCVWNPRVFADDARGRKWQPTPVFLPGESQGRGSLDPALSLGGQASACEGSPGRSLCLTKSSACGRLWQFAHARPLSLLPRGLAPRSKGKARAELRPARRQARLPHSRSLLLPGREG